MAVIDLYSGIGGWSVGFKMADIPVLSSYEWWKDANVTHNKNFQSRHEEIDIRALKLRDLPDPKLVRYVVGSPPCTQFSFANRGGKGDIEDGLVDIFKFLEIVEYLNPEYWAMENVPRVAEILEKRLAKGRLKRFKHLFSDIKVYNSAEFGVPQDRKRMIAGRFPFDLLESYKNVLPKINLNRVINCLNHDPLIDPVYGIELEKARLTDQIFESNLSFEEERLNKEAKTHHPVYNDMSFPDRQDRPSRTVTALCTRVSRESIIIKDKYGNLRRLTVRERASLQSFPINYQFFGNTYASKIKMIGNAVPPLLTFCVAKAMQNISKSQLPNPFDLREKLVFGNELAQSHKPDVQSSSYPWNRSFWMAIKGLRFGSGMRFELKNYHKLESKSTTWQINFFYGNSKSIKEKQLDFSLCKRAVKVIDESEVFVAALNDFQTVVRQINQASLQLNWTHQNRDMMSPITLIDDIAGFVDLLKQTLERETNIHEHIQAFIKKEFKIKGNEISSKKILANSLNIFIGLSIGSLFNTVLNKRSINLKVLQVEHC